MVHGFPEITGAHLRWVGRIGSVVELEVDGRRIRAQGTARRPMPMQGTKQIDLLEL